MQLDKYRANRSQDAINGWKTPDFAPYFHQTGYIVATTGRAPQKATTHLQEALNNVKEHPTFKPHIKPLNSSQEFREAAWQFSGPLTGFTGYINRLAGYAHSADALYGIWKICAARGIRFVNGEPGTVTELLYDGERCSGIRTADGKTHNAALTVVALGAWAASLVPAVGKRVVARCWSVAHVQLTKTECDILRGLPVLNVRDLGFFFEPDPETRLFKLCPLGAGYTNRGKTGVSLPPSFQPRTLPAPDDFIPIEDERKLRRLLQETFPWMADRPFVDKKLCWFADTSDSDYLIDFVPKSSNSLIVLSGDSGHGFKMMPTFGKWVVTLVEAGQQNERRWKWRSNTEDKDWGDEVSWRIGQSKEISELIKEKQKYQRARL